MERFGAGDINNDGLDDVIVGAPHIQSFTSFTGEAFVVFGKTDGTTVELLDVTEGKGGFIMRGIGAQDRLGRSVSGAGDVNGDGLIDIVVGNKKGAFVHLHSVKKVSKKQWQAAQPKRVN